MLSRSVIHLSVSKCFFQIDRTYGTHLKPCFSTFDFSLSAVKCFFSWNICIAYIAWNSSVTTLRLKCEVLNISDCAQKCNNLCLLGEEQWHMSASPLWAAEQMQLKCCYQRQPGPWAKLRYPNANLHPHPLTPSAKLPHFNPILCIELREMIFRRQWVPCREKEGRGD